ncbi:hypothetical protein, partial [Acidianus sp. RZ1]|uniref:hypothetical protein n=1 Tax=Acidianus sp. RZ1 TaxID=1540082 RepID=UPI0014911C24
YSYTFDVTGNFPLTPTAYVPVYTFYSFSNGSALVDDGVEVTFNGTGTVIYEGSLQVFYYPIYPTAIIGLYNYLLILGNKGTLAYDTQNGSYVFTPTVVSNLCSLSGNLAIMNGNNDSLIFDDGSFKVFNSPITNYAFINASYYAIQTKNEIFIYNNGKTYNFNSFDNTLVSSDDEIFIIGTQSTTTFLYDGNTFSVPFSFSSLYPYLYYRNGWFVGLQTSGNVKNISIFIIGHGIAKIIGVPLPSPSCPFYITYASSEDMLVMAYYFPNDLFDEQICVVGLGPLGISFKYNLSPSYNLEMLLISHPQPYIYQVDDNFYLMSSNSSLYFISPSGLVKVANLLNTSTNIVSNGNFLTDNINYELVISHGNLYIVNTSYLELNSFTPYYQTVCVGLVNGARVVPIGFVGNYSCVNNGIIYLGYTYEGMSYIYAINGGSVFKYSFRNISISGFMIDDKDVIALVPSTSPPYLQAGQYSQDLQYSIILSGIRVVREGYVMQIASNLAFIAHLAWYSGANLIITNHTIPLTVIAKYGTITGNGFTISNIHGNETLYLPEGAYVVQQGLMQRTIDLTTPTTVGVTPSGVIVQSQNQTTQTSPNSQTATSTNLPPAMFTTSTTLPIYNSLEFLIILIGLGAISILAIIIKRKK